MVKLLYADNTKVIVLLPDGRVVTILDDRMLMKIPRDGRVPLRKSFEYCDLLAVNDALRMIYPPTNGERVVVRRTTK